MDMNSPSSLFCGTVWMGLEEIAQAELNEKLDNCTIVDVSRGLFGDGKRKIFFTTDTSVTQIIQLRAFEDISICYFRGYFLEGKKRLRQLSRQVSNVLSSPNFFSTLQYHRQVTNISQKIKRPSFKVIGTMKGKQDFRRIDAVKAVQDVIQSQFRRWRFSLENPNLEFWLDIADGKSSFFLRLSQKPFSQRTYKTESYEGSLPPAVAYTLARLSDPMSNQTFIDPMCGLGTIVAERLLFDLEGIVLGGDLNPEVVEKCRTTTHQLNSIHFGRNCSRTRLEFGAPEAKASPPFVKGGRGDFSGGISLKTETSEIKACLGLFCWDAMQLPLQDGTIDKIACNLPFGKKFPISQEILTALVNEFARVVRPSGICVLLMQSQKMFNIALKHCGQWDLERRFVINLLGLRPHVYKLRRR